MSGIVAFQSWQCQYYFMCSLKSINEMKTIVNPWIPPKGFCAINLFGVLFIRPEVKEISRITLNHEEIHTAQMKELGYIFFYIMYVLEWTIRLFQHKGFIVAYYNISFEREAYKNQYDYYYLRQRKHYAFLKYLKKKNCV